MRAIAVLLVFGFHYDVWPLSGGFIGVDVFFVISGFVITRMLRAEIGRRDTIDFGNFYGRRARRLLPACLAMIIVTLAASAAVLSPLEIEAASKAAASASLYFSNFAYLARARDYFAPESALSPFLHTWTLAVEEQFYLVWPAVILLTSKFSRKKQWMIIASLTVLSFAACCFTVTSDQPAAFYASPMRAWEFGIGALVTFIGRVRFAGLLASAGMVGIASSALLLTRDSTFPGITALPATLGCAAVLAAGSTPNGAPRWLDSKPLQWFGKLSYSIYLWHWPVLVLAKAEFPQIGYVGAALCAMLSLLLAWVSFNFLEHPIRTNPWLARRRVRSLALGAALTAIGACTSGGLWIFGEDEERQPDQRPIELAAHQTSPLPLTCLQSFTDTVPKPCAFLSGNRAMVLFGDSHAAQLFTPLMLSARSSHMRLITYLKASCSVSDVPVFNDRLRRSNPECAEWRASVISDIARLHPAVIVVSQSAMGYVRGPGRSDQSMINDPQAWFDGTRRSLERLAATGASVIVIQDSPRMSINVPTCLSRAASHGGSERACDRPLSQVVDQHLSSLEQRASSEAGAHYITTTDLLCSRAICPARRGNWIIYRDGNHIAEETAKRLSPALDARITAAEAK